MIKTLIVLFIFVSILYPLPDNMDVIQGLQRVIAAFVDGGFTGLLALIALFSFIKK